MKSFQDIYEEETQKHERENKQFVKYRGIDIEMLSIPNSAPLSPKYVNNINLSDKDIHEFIQKLKSCSTNSFSPISFVVAKLKQNNKSLKDNFTDKETTILKNYILQFKNEVKTSMNHPLTIHVAKMIIDKLISLMK